MKNIKIIFLLFVGITYGQENKIELRSIDAGIGLYQSNSNSSHEGEYESLKSTGGISGIINLSFDINKNLFAISYQGGARTCILCQSYSFDELRLQYGRESTKNSSNVVFDIFAGMGYFTYSKSGGNFPFTLKTISIPISGNIKFHYKKLIIMGINANYSINKISNTFSVNLIFTYRFIK